MRTNKNCPKHGADPETQLEISDSEKASGKSSSSSQSQQKNLKKKLIIRSVTKITVVEAPEDETPSKCGARKRRVSCQQEERQKAKKKKPEIGDEYLEQKRNDRKMPEGDGSAKRRPVVELGSNGAEQSPPTTQRRGGQVGLSNVLERIVGALREKKEVSYLFLKPVSKKEAPDYLNIVKRPMDLSR